MVYIFCNYPIPNRLFDINPVMTELSSILLIFSLSLPLTMTTHPTRLATSTSTPLSTAQRTEVPQKCYVTGKVPDPKICPAQFRVNTDSRQKCYEYCYYTASCEMFSFKSGDTVCFLYKEYHCDWQPTKEQWITGLKTCLLQMVSNQKCLTITEFSADKTAILW